MLLGAMAAVLWALRWTPLAEHARPGTARTRGGRAAGPHAVECCLHLHAWSSACAA